MRLTITAILTATVGACLGGCIHGYYWPVPRQYQGEYVVNSLGATVYPCNVGPGLFSGNTPGWCFEARRLECADCVPVFPGTPVRILNTYVFEDTDVTLAIGDGLLRKVAHMSARNWDAAAKLLMDGLSRPTHSEAELAKSCPRGARDNNGPWHARMVDHGLYKVALDSKNSDLAVVSNVQLQQQTEQIAAAIGVSFGFRYELSGPDAGATVMIQVEHPALRDPLTGRSFALSQWSQWLPANQVNWNSGFLFQHDWEIQPGDWTMRLCIDSVPLLEQHFEVHDARH